MRRRKAARDTLARLDAIALFGEDRSHCLARVFLHAVSVVTVEIRDVPARAQLVAQTCQQRARANRRHPQIEAERLGGECAREERQARSKKRVLVGDVDARCLALGLPAPDARRHDAEAGQERGVFLRVRLADPGTGEVNHELRDRRHPLPALDHDAVGQPERREFLRDAERPRRAVPVRG